MHNFAENRGKYTRPSCNFLYFRRDLCYIHFMFSLGDASPLCIDAVMLAEKNEH